MIYFELNLGTFHGIFHWSKHVESHEMSLWCFDKKKKKGPKLNSISCIKQRELSLVLQGFKSQFHLYICACMHFIPAISTCPSP